MPLTDLQALFYVHSGLIAGNLTLITVVVSIDQLLLSRELQTPGELQDQIESVIEFHEDVEDATGEIAPVEPLGFLRLLVEGTREESQRLGGLSRDGVVGDGDEEIRDLVSEITRQMDEVDALLTQSDTGTFGVLSVLLETNYAPRSTASGGCERGTSRTWTTSSRTRSTT